MYLAERGLCYCVDLVWLLGRGQMYRSNGRDIHGFHVCHIVIAIFCSTSSL